MAGNIGLIALGILLGLVSLEAGPFGLLLSLVVVGALLASPRAARPRSVGLLLTSAAITASVLLGRVVFIDARDPAVSMAPGTRETFIASVVLSLVGLVVTIVGRPRATPTRKS